MRRDEFVAAVEAVLGQDLQQATVENVRELVAWFNEQSGASPREGERLLVEGDPDATIEASTNAFLAECLHAEPEAARQQLWIALLEAWYGMIEVEAEAQFGALFQDLPPGDQP